MKVEMKSFPLRRSVTLMAAIAAMLLSSCAAPQKRTAVAKAAPPPAPLYEWHGEGMSGPVAVKIHLDEQKAYIYRGGQQAGWTMLASGKASHPSPTGSFSVMEKIQNKVSNTYGIVVDRDGDVVNWDAQAGVSRIPAGGKFVGAPMPYWMRLTSYGVGMHAGDIPDPGYPASHGCIRLPREFAPVLFSVVHEGTPVTITGRPRSPEDKGSVARAGGGDASQPAQ